MSKAVFAHTAEPLLKIISFCSADVRYWQNFPQYVESRFSKSLAFVQTHLVSSWRFVHSEVWKETFWPNFLIVLTIYGFGNWVSLPESGSSIDLQYSFGLKCFWVGFKKFLLSTEFSQELAERREFVFLDSSSIIIEDSVESRLIG